MPLTKFQENLAILLSTNRSPESHLAGGAAIHLDPNSIRFSNDLDYFNDSDQVVAKAFEADQKLLEKNKYQIKIEVRQPGYIRVLVSLKNESTKIEWAFDSLWRFMPPIKNEVCGYMLHPIDLAINKILALAGRDEPRDFLDTILMHENTLSLGAMVWAAVGKDPGFNPRSLLELLKRRGKYRPEDFNKLLLKKEVDLQILKQRWLQAVSDAEIFIDQRPAEETGCLYFSKENQKFISPSKHQKQGLDYELHFGRPGGLIPVFSK